MRSDLSSPSRSGLASRRSFLATAGAGALGVGLLADVPAALAHQRLTKGDEAILRFLSAAEILETDLWQQYNELAGIQDSEVPGGSGNSAYTDAVAQLDADMAQYIHDNTEDEFTHFTFLNAYLKARGGAPVHLDKFRTLPSSTATGAQQIKRLTNLMALTVDTTWWTRYRSGTQNPDKGGSFPPAVPGLMKGQFPAIPRSDADLAPSNHLQAIANTAGFHFATIEQGGTSLYPSLAQRVTDPEVLRVLLSIGPTETMHFQTWMDKAGNAPPLTDPTNGLTFPDLNSPPFGGEEFQTNLIMPEPTIFLSRKFPRVSIIRPTGSKGAAMGALKFLTADGLFRGQSAGFFKFMKHLAHQADAARRENHHHHQRPRCTSELLPPAHSSAEGDSSSISRRRLKAIRSQIQSSDRWREPAHGRLRRHQDILQKSNSSGIHSKKTWCGAAAAITISAITSGAMGTRQPHAGNHPPGGRSTCWSWWGRSLTSSRSSPSVLAS